MQQGDQKKACSVLFAKECYACLQSPLEGEGCSISHEPRKISTRESCGDVTPVTASSVTTPSWPGRICREKSQRGTRACTDAASSESNSLLQYQSVSSCHSDTHHIQARQSMSKLHHFGVLWREEGPGGNQYCTRLYHPLISSIRSHAPLSSLPD